MFIQFQTCQFFFQTHSCQKICNYEELQGCVRNHLVLRNICIDPTRTCLSHGIRITEQFVLLKIGDDCLRNDNKRVARNEFKIDGRQKNGRIIGSRCPRELTLEHPLVCNWVTSQPHAQPPLRNRLTGVFTYLSGHIAYSFSSFRNNKSKAQQPSTCNAYKVKSSYFVSCIDLVLVKIIKETPQNGGFSAFSEFHISCLLVC